MISKLARPLTASSSGGLMVVAGCAGQAAVRTAACRSPCRRRCAGRCPRRTRRTVPAASMAAAACRPPVRAKFCCPACSSSGARAISAGGISAGRGRGADAGQQIVDAVAAADAARAGGEAGAPAAIEARQIQARAAGGSDLDGVAVARIVGVAAVGDRADVGRVRRMIPSAKQKTPPPRSDRRPACAWSAPGHRRRRGSPAALR